MNGGIAQKRPSPRRRVRLHGLPIVLLVAVCSLSLAGCVRADSPSDSAPSAGSAQPSYAPLPDDQLFAAIRALPSVTSSEVSFTDNITHGIQYRGTIYVDGSVDPVRVLDQANAILWQGRPARLAIEVVSGTRTSGSLAVTQRSLGLDLIGSQAEAAYEKRYGPRPGTGQPPATSP